MRLGRYELQRVLGSGGSGTVYEATVAGSGGARRVALKVLQEGAESLWREAQITGRLRHRHLVDVYEVGEEDGRWFCAMELCGRGALSGLEPLPPRAVVEVGLAVCAALSYAHEALGLVHLDLKPANLMLTDDGIVKVADLGIARAEGFAADRRIQGSPRYMAPEQARGGAVDARTDIYALGVTLRELATGQPGLVPETLVLEGTATRDEAYTTWAFDGPQDLAPPTPAGPELPEALEGVLNRCLAPSPSDRWPDMSQLAQALEALDVPGLDLASHLGIAGPSASADAGRSTLHGRQAELARLLTWLERPGSGVVKGPAGIGKSRLVREAAARWEGTRARPCWTVDLVDTQETSGMVYRVAAALDIQLGASDPVQRLGYALRGRGAGLLVLEHVDRLPEIGATVERWTQLAPELRVLVTSRAALDLPGEVLELGPLSEQAARDLVVDRAQARGVDVTGDPTVGDLVRRLDGLPLALELAAGRLGVLSITDILERLDLNLLRGATDGRHGTLRAALEWGWEALSEAERSTLAQLSVFARTFDLPSARAVADGEGVEAQVRALVDKSLLRVEDGWLTWFSSVQEHAREKLGEGQEVEARHGRYLARLGTDRELALLDGPQGPDRRRLLARWMDNLILAHRRAVARGDAEVARRTARAAQRVTEIRGPFQLGTALIRQALTVGGMPDRERSVYLRALGWALHLEGSLAEAEARLEEAVACSRRTGDRVGEARARGDLGRVLQEQGRVALSTEHLEAAIAGLEGRERDVVWARLQTSLASSYRLQGRLDDAQRLLDPAREVAEREGADQAMLVVQAELAMIHFEAGRTAEARAACARAEALARKLGNWRDASVLLVNLATLDSRAGRSGEAEATFRRAIELQERMGFRRGIAAALGPLANHYQNLGRLVEAERAYSEAISLFRQVGSRRAEGLYLGNLGVLHWKRGRGEEAEACLREAWPILQEVGHVRGQCACLCYLARHRIDEGRWEEGEATLQETRALLRNAPNRRVQPLLCQHEGTVALQLGRLHHARASLQEGVRLAREFGDVTLGAPIEAELGRLAWLQGELDEADAILAPLVSAPQAPQVPFTRAWAQSTLARVHLVAGRLPQAAQLADQAVAAARPYRRLLAECLVDRALVALERGELQRAQQDVEAAYRLDRRGLTGARAAAARALVTGGAGALQEARQLAGPATEDSEVMRLIARGAGG